MPRIAHREVRAPFFTAILARFLLHCKRKICYATSVLPFRDYNPSRTFPIVTLSLIVLNTLVLLYMTYLNVQGGDTALQHFVDLHAVIPDHFTHPENGEVPWLTIFTAMFMHAGFLHLAGNMLYLWIFGNNIEDIMGPVRFIIFYLLCGIIATLAHIFISPDSTLPSLGASGAIAGVLGAYLVKFPRAQIDSCLFLFVFVTVVRLPAIVVLAFWFVLQLFNGVASLVNTSQQNLGGVAFWAHIGGFLAGMILVNVFAKRQPTTYDG